MARSRLPMACLIIFSAFVRTPCAYGIHLASLTCWDSCSGLPCRADACPLIDLCVEDASSGFEFCSQQESRLVADSLEKNLLPPSHSTRGGERDVPASMTSPLR